MLEALGGWCWGGIAVDYFCLVELGLLVFIWPVVVWGWLFVPMRRNLCHICLIYGFLVLRLCAR